MAMGAGDEAVTEGCLQLVDHICDSTERDFFAEEVTGFLLASPWASREGGEMDGEPIQLKSLPPCQHIVLDWEMDKVKEIQRCVGIECKGFKE